MKYIFINLIFFFAGLGVTLAQNLSLSDLSGALNNGDYVYVYGDSGMYTLMQSHFEVHNNGSSSIDVRVKKTQISIVPGSMNTFCWGACYDSSVYISGDIIAIAAGGTNQHDFSGDYFPKGHLGASTIMYTFYDNSNPNDSVCVNVVYTATAVGIEENSPMVEFSNAYPNPASSMVHFNYTLNHGSYDAAIIVSDLLGGEAIRQTVPVNGSQISLDVSALTSGVYFYSLHINGEPQFTRKLIVKH
ncbi:MAG: hypothetical protein C0592_03810 [Marinilabiliales bacterium]|nr:MAG: hypothetical protein C0592_03810 [Marinilabiliales bacterium]